MRKLKFKLLVPHLLNSLFLFVVKIKEQAESVFCTVHGRPKYAKNFGLWSDKIKNESLTAIIIQGPIIKKHNFTLETIKIYKKLFKEAIIILSTWEDADKNDLEKIKQENIEIVLNKKPGFFGQQNINLQIVSSFSGLELAKKLGAEYAIKTRTDQRMYAPNSLDFLRNTLEVFPLHEGIAMQKKRIVGVSLNTFKYRPYGLSDMTIFGHIDDLLLYWGADLDSRVLSTDSLMRTVGDFVNGRICEVYLVTEFLKKLGYLPKMTVTDSWEVFAKYFCVIDQNSLDLYWHKYDRHTEHKRLSYKNILNNQSMTFSEWLNIYINLNNKVRVPEEILKDKFGSIIQDI